MFLQLNNSIRIKLALTVIIILAVFSCKKEKVAPTVNNIPDNTSPYDKTPYILNIPTNFPNLPSDTLNPLTIAGVGLGRKLYYDPIISNNGLSCSSCHDQSKGFTTYNSNSLVHINLAWNSNFLWSGKISGTLEDQMLFEVNDFFNSDVSKLNNNSEYKYLFKKAFNISTITKKDVAYALAQFFRSLISSNSKFDRFLRHEVNLTSSEVNGFIIFNTEKGDCFHCHSIPLMSDNSFRNIGLDSIYTNTNWGRFEVTNNPSDIGKYKVPTLRNIELSAPYMHDGRFNTLELVIEHYNSGVKKSSTIDPIMTKPGKEYGLLLTPQDKIDLVSFLKTLTDSTFITNSAFSKPQ